MNAPRMTSAQRVHKPSIFIRTKAVNLRFQKSYSATENLQFKSLQSTRYAHTVSCISHSAVRLLFFGTHFGFHSRLEWTLSCMHQVWQIGLIYRMFIAAALWLCVESVARLRRFVVVVFLLGLRNYRTFFKTLVSMHCIQ